MAHCFDIHKSDRPCPHAPPEKQIHVFMRYYFRAESLRDAGIRSGKICKGGTLISSLKWLGNFHMTSL
jgi:hypothetical protein